MLVFGIQFSWVLIILPFSKSVWIQFNSLFRFYYNHNSFVFYTRYEKLQLFCKGHVFLSKSKTFISICCAFLCINKNKDRIEDYFNMWDDDWDLSVGRNVLLRCLGSFQSVAVLLKRGWYQNFKLWYNISIKNGT